MTSGCSVLTNTATRHSGTPLSAIRRHSSASTSSESDPDRAPSVSQSTTDRMSLKGALYSAATGTLSRNPCMTWRWNSSSERVDSDNDRSPKAKRQTR